MKKPLNRPHLRLVKPTDPTPISLTEELHRNRLAMEDIRSDLREILEVVLSIRGAIATLRHGPSKR